MAATPIRPRCRLPKNKKGKRGADNKQLERFPSDNSHQKRVKVEPPVARSFSSPFLYVRAGEPAGYAKDYKTFRASRQALKSKIFL
jgi:SH3-like domain-containing protein